MIELFKWRAFKLPRTVYRMLGKEKAWGKFDGNRTIEIDKRLKGKREMEIHIHEMTHWIDPEMEEEDVIKLSRKLTDYLWREGYRKADHDEK